MEGVLTENEISDWLLGKRKGQLLSSEGWLYEPPSDEDMLARSDPEGYDLNVNGIRRVPVKQASSTIVWDITPNTWRYGQGRITQMDLKYKIGSYDG